MARTDARHNSHIQEKRPPTGAGAPPAPPEPDAEEGLDAQEGRSLVWRWAAMVWAIVFLFLTFLAIYDLFGGLIGGLIKRPG